MRVVIAEDLALLREGMARLLTDNGFEVVAAVADADALVHAVLRERPDVAIVDIRLPPSFRDEGLRAALGLRRSAPGTAILVVSQYVEHTYATELLAEAGAGGVGYLLKDRVLDVSDFVDAVRRVASGGTALDPGGRSRRASGRCWSSWPRDGRTRRSPRPSCSQSAPSRSTTRASSRSSGSRLPTPTTAACSPCWSTSGASAAAARPPGRR